MKILIIHNQYKIRSGEYKVFTSELRMLKESGHEVEVVLFDNKDIVSFFSKIKAAIFSIYNPFSSKLIRNKISGFNPDIIHVHNFFPLISPSVFFRRTRRKVPLVMTLHNYRLICANAVLFRGGDICEKCIHKVFPLRGVFHRCYRHSFFQTLNVVIVVAIHKLIGTWKGRVDRYIALTRFQKSKLLNSSLGLNEDQIVVKPNFVFDFGERENQDRGAYFIYIGRLDESKGVRTLLISFQNSEHNLVIIGEGPMKEEVSTAGKGNKNIDYLGTRDNQFVLEKLQASKGLIFPSFYYEGFPIVIAEAFSLGIPVICSDVGSHAEIVTDGFDGFHFKVGDPADLKKKVRAVDEMKNNSIYKNARTTSVKYFSAEKNYKMLMKIYREAIEKKKIT